MMLLFLGFCDEKAQENDWKAAGFFARFPVALAAGKPEKQRLFLQMNPV